MSALYSTDIFVFISDHSEYSENSEYSDYSETSDPSEYPKVGIFPKNSTRLSKKSLSLQRN